jgi:hypothetical protein
MDWIDQNSGAAYRITTEGHYGIAGVARVKTYGNVLEEYEWHSESKCADANGSPSEKGTIGLLQRRHVLIRAMKYIGKESNHPENVEAVCCTPLRAFTRSIRIHGTTNGTRSAKRCNRSP